MSDAEIESNLELIGVAGSADKMQEDVHSCISDFKAAGIKVWIVTGDKDSTARAVGYQSGILSQDREILHLTSELAMDKTALVNKICSGSINKDLMISGTAFEVLLEVMRGLEENASMKETRKNLADAFI